MNIIKEKEKLIQNLQKDLLEANTTISQLKNEKLEKNLKNVNFQILQENQPEIVTERIENTKIRSRIFRKLYLSEKPGTQSVQQSNQSIQYNDFNFSKIKSRNPAETKTVNKQFSENLYMLSTRVKNVLIKYSELIYKK